MNNRPPLNETFSTPVVSTGWANWFSQVFLGMPWARGFNKLATLDFPSIDAHKQAALKVTVLGVRSKDAVQIAPTADVAGMIFTGVVTANDEVTVYAKNVSAAAIDPASQVYRLIVLQD